MSPESNKTRKIICQDKVCHVSYSSEAGAEQCFIRSHNPDEICQEMPVDASTNRRYLAKRFQYRANKSLLLGNARMVHHATGDAQSQFRPRIKTIQKVCRRPDKSCWWFTRLVVKAFKTNINKMVYQVRLIQLPPGNVVHPENKTCHGKQNGLWIGWRHKAICFLSTNLV